MWPIRLEGYPPSLREVDHRVGLLPEPARTPNGYREYSLRDAVELARVRRLTELGLSLDEVGAGLAGVPADDPRPKPPRSAAPST